MKPKENVVFVTNASGVSVIHGHQPPYTSHSIPLSLLSMFDTLVAATYNPLYTVWFWST